MLYLIFDIVSSIYVARQQVIYGVDPTVFPSAHHLFTLAVIVLVFLPGLFGIYRITKKYDSKILLADFRRRRTHVSSSYRVKRDSRKRLSLHFYCSGCLSLMYSNKSPGWQEKQGSSEIARMATLGQSFLNSAVYSKSPKIRYSLKMPLLSIPVTVPSSALV